MGPRDRLRRRLPQQGVGRSFTGRLVGEHVQDPGGAHDSFREQVAAATGPNDKGLVFKRLPTGGAIGHESRLYVARTTSGGVTVDVYAVVWRYSSVTAAIIGAGIAPTVDAHVVVDLARKQQRHILAAVG